MVRHGGTPALPTASNLPVVSFEKVEDVMAHARDTKLSRTLYGYGFADDSEFTRPESYMQHIEPLESELAVQVEYDMDEQDKEWLDLVNKDRSSNSGYDQISPEVFEIIMDRLEKEWFNLTKNIPKPDFALPSEDSTCAICDDSEGENSNAIVFCDECNLAVHQDCYGIPYIPEGQWLCRKCTVAPDSPVSCLLCPNEGGAFKQTTNGDWVHLLCAIWVPETRVANEVFMEPITGVERISKQRWKLNCSICRIKEGACIQCAKTSCFLAFHVTCARKERLLSAMKSAHGTEPAALTCYCERHLPREQAEARDAAIAAEEAEEEQNPGHAGKSSKSARAYTKGYKPGPPIVPAIIVNNINAYTQKVKMRKHIETIQMICRYWSLKREKRRGAPLLKRLHLEPWTASASGKIQTEEEQRMKLDQMHRLLNDLVRLKQTSWHITQREKIKLEQARVIEGVLDDFLLSRDRALWDAFYKVKSLDNRDHFLNPVNKQQVPDYFDIIQHPMCWTMIEAKLNRHEYWDIETFKADICLVIDNAILYNKPGTTFQKAAIKIQGALEPIFTKLYQAVDKQPPTQSSLEAEHAPHAPATTQAPGLVGDFEPSIDVLELLFSKESIVQDRLAVGDNPLQSLFKIDFARDKPPLTAQPKQRPAPKAKREARKTARVQAAIAKEQDATAREQEAATGEQGPTARQRAATAPTEPEAVRAIAQTEAKKPPVRKRQLSGNGQDLVPLVEEVDNQKSFKLFDKGWILPPDSKRHNRAPLLDRAASVPRPKKRSRLEPGSSRITDSEGLVPDDQGGHGVSSDKELEDDADVTAGTVNEGLGQPEEQQPLIHFDKPSGPANEPALQPVAKPPSSRDAIRSRTTQPPESTLGRSTDFPPRLQVVTMENGTVVVEELDTPAIRREKAMRKKVERQLTAQEGTSHAGPSDGPGTLSDVAPVSRRKEEREGDGSAASDLSDTNSPKTSKRPVSSRFNKKRLVPYPQMKEGDPSEGVALVHGTLVWAKSNTYPWWPASIFDEDDPKVPLNVIQAAKKLRKKDTPGSTRYFLQFFDKQKSWELLLGENLRMLGEDKSFDEAMLAKPSPYQKWKSQIQREDCHRAYQEAITDIETSSEAEPEGTDSHN